MKIGRLNHVGVATSSIAETLKVYRDLLGATQITEITALPPQGVSFCFVKLENAEIELIEPYGDASPITTWLEKNPKGGQHHIAYEVEDIHAAAADMKAAGCTVLGEPRIGAHGTLVVFVHPKNMGGVLVELMEPVRGAH